MSTGPRILAAALAAMALAAPVVAQVNTVRLTGGNGVAILKERNDGCNFGSNGINLTSSANIPANTEVQYLVSTTQGYNHFRNHDVAVLLSNARMEILAISEAT